MKFYISDTKYLVSYIVPIGTFLSLYFGGSLSFIVPVYAFIIIPLLEILLPQSAINLSEKEETEKEKNIFFDILLYLNVLFQYGLLLYMLFRVTQTDLLWWEKTGMIFSMGISCGVLGINVAHELGHRTSLWEQRLSKALLLTSMYMHFFIEHNRGHHKNVSTKEDPASAKKNESIYAFYFRSITCSFISAWNLEKLRLERIGKKTWSIKNEIIQFIIIEFFFAFAIGLYFGFAGLIAFLCAAAIGILLLETVNYIEHYGLRRKEIEPGIYEKVKPTHSWNSDHYLGRIMLYELTRHSDHHYKATRKYQVLRHFDESPQLPFGYPGSMVLSLFPPLWFKTMNPLVDQWQTKNDLRIG